MGTQLELDAAAVAGVVVPRPLRRPSEMEKHERADSTRDTYAREWARWESWCALRGLVPLPADPEHVTWYIDAASARRPPPPPASVGIVLAAIAAHHRVAGLVSPTEDQRVKSARRGFAAWWQSLEIETHGAARPLSPADLAAILCTIASDEPGRRRGRTLSTWRDGAVIALGWHAAMRPAALGRVLVRDVEEHPEGLRLHVRRDKNHRTKGRTVYVDRVLGDPEMCAAWWWRQWIERDKPEHGFQLSGPWIAEILRRWARRANVSTFGLSGHSLRRGCLTAASAAGIPVSDMMATSGHADASMVAHYARPEFWKAAIGARALLAAGIGRRP